MRQANKTRYLNAVKHIEQEAIPFFEMEADIAIVRQMMGKNYDFSLHSFELPIEDVVAWNREMGNDMVYFSHVWHLGRKEWKDELGRLHYVNGLIKNKEDLKSISFPDLDELERRLESLCNQIQGTGFGLIVGAQTAGFTVPTAIGYEDFYLALYMDPEFVADFQKRVHEYSMKELEMYFKYPVDVVKLASAMITGTGSVISPEMLEQYELRFMKEQADFIKSNDSYVIFHVDGWVEPLIPKFLEMGADILHPIDTSVKEQNIYRIKEEYGDRITLCGNIDINGVLINGTPEAVKKDVEEHMEKLAIEGGYIVGSSHDLHQDLPVENIYAMRDAVHGYRFPLSN